MKTEVQLSKGELKLLPSKSARLNEILRPNGFVYVYVRKGERQRELKNGKTDKSSNKKNFRYISNAILFSQIEHFTN